MAQGSLRSLQHPGSEELALLRGASSEEVSLPQGGPGSSLLGPASEKLPPSCKPVAFSGVSSRGFSGQLFLHPEAIFQGHSGARYGLPPSKCAAKLSVSGAEGSWGGGGSWQRCVFLRRGAELVRGRFYQQSPLCRCVERKITKPAFPFSCPVSFLIFLQTFRFLHQPG